MIWKKNGAARHWIDGCTGEENGCIVYILYKEQENMKRSSHLDLLQRISNFNTYTTKR